MALYQIARLLLSGCDLLSFLDLFHSRTSKRAGKIIADPSHPGQHLFQRLPSGRRFRAIKTKTSRHLNSFFPTHKQAPCITLTLGNPPHIHTNTQGNKQAHTLTLTNAGMIYVSNYDREQKRVTRRGKEEH